MKTEILQHLRYKLMNDDNVALTEGILKIRKNFKIDVEISLRIAYSIILVLRDYWFLTRSKKNSHIVYSLIMKVWISSIENVYEKIIIVRHVAEMLYERDDFVEIWNFLKQIVKIFIVICFRNLSRNNQRYMIFILSKFNNDICVLEIVANINFVQVL